jgi:hypothetical protein
MELQTISIDPSNSVFHLVGLKECLHKSVIRVLFG